MINLPPLPGKYHSSPNIYNMKEIVKKKSIKVEHFLNLFLCVKAQFHSIYEFMWVFFMLLLFIMLLFLRFLYIENLKCYKNVLANILLRAC